MKLDGGPQGRWRTRARNGGTILSVNRALERASLVEAPKEGQTAALSALLKATAAYGASEPGGLGDIATFETGAVSLPDDVHNSPSIGALCPASASHHLEEFESMLRPLSEVQEMDGTIGKVVPHQDQKLAGSERLYARFVNDLDRRGLLCWSQAPKVQCSCFFIRKKPSACGVCLRMIVDCRPANRRFEEPPSTVLASPESLARIELGESDTLNASTVDVRSFCLSQTYSTTCCRIFRSSAA